MVIGEMDYIDSVKGYQNGSRKRFPLFYNGELLSFEIDANDPLSGAIDLDSVLLIFINGVLQTPGYAYSSLVEHHSCSKKHQKKTIK